MSAFEVFVLKEGGRVHVLIYEWFGDHQSAPAGF